MACHSATLEKPKPTDRREAVPTAGLFGCKMPIVTAIENAPERKRPVPRPRADR